MKNPTFLRMLLLIAFATIISASPLAKLRNQHTFLKRSEIVKIPTKYQKGIDPDNQNPDDPEEPDCAIMCKETSDGFPFCDCQHEVPLMLATILEFIKTNENNDTTPDPEEPDCNEICKTTTDGFPVCDCGGPHAQNIPIKNLVKDQEPNCTEVCKGTTDGFPVCDCGGPHGLNIPIKNLVKDQEPNCTEICKDTSDGFPVCECPDPPSQKSPKLVPKSHDDNHSDLYDCEAICKNTSDGFPMCECDNKPPTKIQKRKRILPIQLFKTQKLIPFANYYP